jgi:hypothetical protein
MHKRLSSALFVLGAALFASHAKAATTYTLDRGECCATVSLNSIKSSTAVQVTVSLTSGDLFANTGSGNHPGFGFNINGDPAVNITPVSGNFTVGSGSVATNGPSYGSFDYFLSAPGNGTNAKVSSLVFDVS